MPKDYAMDKLIISYKKGSNIIEVSFPPEYNGFKFLRYVPAEKIEYCIDSETFRLVFKNSIILKRFFKIY